MGDGARNSIAALPVRAPLPGAHSARQLAPGPQDALLSAWRTPASGELPPTRARRAGALADAGRLPSLPRRAGSSRQTRLDGCPWGPCRPRGSHGQSGGHCSQATQPGPPALLRRPGLLERTRQGGGRAGRGSQALNTVPRLRAEGRGDRWKPEARRTGDEPSAGRPSLTQESRRRTPHGHTARNGSEPDTPHWKHVSSRRPMTWRPFSLRPCERTVSAIRPQGKQHVCDREHKVASGCTDGHTRPCGGCPDARPTWGLQGHQRPPNTSGWHLGHTDTLTKPVETTRVIPGRAKAPDSGK